MDYNGPERRTGFDAAVYEAALNAAQQIGQLSRRRQVVQSIIGAVVAACAIMIPVITVGHNSNRQFAKQNAIYDCTLFAQAAQAIGDFVDSDVALRKKQDLNSNSKEVITGFTKIISAQTLQKLIKASRENEARVIAQWQKDGHLLLSLGRTDCAARLSGSSPPRQSHRQGG